MAGVFDGEGYISAQVKDRYHKRATYTRLLVGIGMTNRDVPEMFKASFGGNIGHYKQRTCTMHQWYVTGSKAIPVLEMLSAYCRLKRPQAELALQLAYYMRGVGSVRGLRTTAVISPDERESRIMLATRICEMKHEAKMA